MLLDMKPMLRGEVHKMAIDGLLSPGLPDGVTAKGDAHVEGTITDEGGYMRMTLTATVPFETTCARCLDPVCDDFSVSLERTVVNEGVLTERQLEENVDEYIIIEKGNLSLDQVVWEEILLSFPSRVLCNENCPGLCSKCGKSLKDGDCGCPKIEIDPRLEKLLEWKEKN